MNNKSKDETMSSFYDAFLSFRNIFTGEQQSNIADTETILEGLKKMAADLTRLIEEVDRVKNIQEQAIQHISTLVADVKVISDQLAAKTTEAENAVDMDVINSLVEKLKASTDSLSNAVVITKDN